MASGFTDEVLELDAATGSIVQRISVDRRPREIDEPHGIAVAPDGQHWYVSLAHGNPSLWKFERAGNRLVGRLTLDMPGAARIAITPDGTRAFVPDYNRGGMGQPGQVAVIQLESLELIARLEVCPAPHDAQIHPRGDVVAITCSLSDEIVLLDVNTLEVSARFPVDPEPGMPGAPSFRPLNASWVEDELWVGLHLADAVRVFDRTGAILATIPVGVGPAQLIVVGDDRIAVANRGDGSLSVIDVTERRERQRIPLEASHPHGVAVNAAEGEVFVTYEGETETTGGVLAVDVSRGRVRWRTEAGVYTLGIAFAPPVTRRP